MTELEQSVVSLYATGLNIHQVAKKCEIGPRRANKILRANNVLIRTGSRKYTLNEHVFDVIDNELKAYWYGFLYADGCINKQYVQLFLSSKDAEFLQGFADFMEADTPIRIIQYDKWERAQFTISSKHLTDRARELGLGTGRPFTSRIFENVPPHLFPHWLRGFFDGDGSADARKSIWFCGSNDLMTAIRDILAKEAGRNPALKVSKHSISDIYYIRYKGYNNAHAVADYMYQDATFWMKRKLDVINSWKEPLSHPDRAILGWEKRRTHPCRKNQYA